MKDRLIEYCRSLNLEYVGIAPPGPYFDFEKVWIKQIEKGHISGFEEKDIKRRVYTDLTLEGTRSVIVCLFPYYTGNAEGANLSKYSYSLDYHTIIKDKLESIGKFLEGNVQSFRYKSFVDNGPFSDRYLAWKAGLGFWGINNHIITDKYGSYVFIGYILNNFPFEPDEPQQRTCCQCFECVRKCPGQCILGDFTINPQRCKSYITQKKGGLTESDIEILTRHDLIWGCDVCQDVCPHNKNVEATKIEEFRTGLIYKLCYGELKQISNKEFMKRYGGRSFSWRGKGILQRNYEIINKIK